MRKYLDKIGGAIKKYMPGKAAEQEGEHTQPKTYTLGKRTVREDKLLSEGAFGYIWKAVDVNTNETFALKRVICTSQESLDNAKKELEVMRKLKTSPNLVRFYAGDVFKQAGGKSTVIILMQLCPNGTLFDQLVCKQQTGFTQPQLIKIMQSTARGILAVHNSGYFHRDIKIQNVILGKDDNYKICDFGSCTDQTVDFSTIASTNYADYTDQMQKNTTPMYRPPEIADPFLKYIVSDKVDVWMLGCVLYTLCYFVHPFLEATKIGISRAVYRFPKQPKVKYSQKINDLIRHLLTPNPLHRPSIESVIDLLNQWKSIKMVPLNVEAERIKQEQQEAEKQMGKYDKKVVDFDGDIPLDELMKIQEKLNKKVETQQVITTFVKKKEQPATQVIKPQVKPVPQTQPISKISEPKKIDNSVWNINTEVPKPKIPIPKNSDFDFFSEFATQPSKPTPTPAAQPKNPPTSSQNSNSNVVNQDDLFDYFSSVQEQPSPISSTPAFKPQQAPNPPIKPTASLDLLDLL